jgi:glycosyltransferase involved in cell wall biosynthesis
VRVAIVTGELHSEQVELWRACREEKVEVFLVGTARRLWGSEWPWRPGLPDDLDGVQLDPIGPRRRRGHLWWWYPGLGRALQSFRPDLVHVLSEPWGCLVLQSLLLAHRARRTIPVCAHGCDNLYRHGAPMARQIRRVVLGVTLPRIAGLASWNRAGIQCALEMGLPEGTPRVVIPAVVPNPDRFQPVRGAALHQLRRRLGLPTDRVVIGFLGRLVPEKGLADLVAALSALDGSAPFLAVWGHGPDAALLEAYLSRPGRGIVSPPLPLGEVGGALAACDLLVVPSRTTPTWAEQFGRVVVEGMLSGCAVVAYNSGALPEVVGEGGVLVPERDAAALSQAIGHIAAKPALRREIARRGREHAISAFSPAVLAPRIVAFWQEVLDR